MPSPRRRPRPPSHHKRAPEPAEPHFVEEHGESLSLERIVFLSDGVFAIAMTILVLEIKLPELPTGASAEALTEALLEQIPSLGAYALSFAVLGAYWMAHWRRFQRIARANGRLAWINLAFLGCIALIPFPTAVLGRFNWDISVVLYAVVLSLAGFAGAATGLYAARAGLTEPGVPTSFRDSGVLRGLIVPIVFLASLLLLPFASPTIVELSWIAILPLSVLTRPRR